MKRFEFRLGSLLRVRSVEEDRRLGEFRRRQKEFLDATEQLSSISAERETVMSRLRNLEDGVLPIEEILYNRRYLNKLGNDDQKVRGQLSSFRTRMEQAKCALDRAMRDRKVMERVRERQYRAYLESMRRHETAELDESAHARVMAREES